MRWQSARGTAAAMAAMMMAACWVEVAEPVPGALQQRLEGNWVQGEASEVYLAWNNANDCRLEDWSCEPKEATTTLLEVECSGCDVLPRTESATVNAGGELKVRVVPTTDATIELRATLRFDATGDIESITVLQRGDHEVSLAGHCRLIDTAALHDKTQGGERNVPEELFRACETPRLATDSVVVFPVIRTYRGRELFPFGSGKRARELLTFSASKVLWAFSPALPTAFFVELPRDFAAAQLTMTAPLADGATVTGLIDIPAVTAQ